MKKSTVYLIALVFLLAALLIAIWSIDSARPVDYSSFPIGLTKGIIGCLTLIFIDEIILGKIDTIHEIREKNMSYAIILFAFALIIAFAIGFS